MWYICALPTLPNFDKTMWGSSMFIWFWAKKNMSIRENSFAHGKKMNSQDQSWFCPQKENAASKAAWILFYLFHFQSHPRHEGTKYCLKRSPRFSSSSTKAEETSKTQGSLRSSGDFCLMFRLEKWWFLPKKTCFLWSYSDVSMFLFPSKWKYHRPNRDYTG